MSRAAAWPGRLLPMVAAWLLLGLSGCPASGPECEQDADCPAGRYCVAEACHYDCATDADCRDGFRCSPRGRCEPFCESDADCPGGRHCEAGACVSECTADFDCAAGEVCTEQGRCEPACTPSNGGIEACDGQDNDCDGSTDEDFAQLGEACSNGDCAEGRYVCAADGLSEICDGPVPADDDSVCDGLDEDCDGQTDEDVAPRACPLSAGVCAGATESCLGAAGWSGCDYGPGYTEGIDAACDQVDSDCDGLVDEDAPTLLVPEAGALATDGQDNNCNGLVDEPGGVMVPVPSRPDVWIDAYEIGVYAAADCSGQQYGLPGDDYPAAWPAEGAAGVELYACSLPDQTPSAWLSWYRADRACRAQGKRLCKATEWELGCMGPDSNNYPYGLVLSPGACNDWTGPGHAQPSGATAGCVSVAQVYDASGNLAEWLDELDPDHPDCQDCARTAGFAFRCEVCTWYGLWCDPCDPDDPDDWTHMRYGYDCQASGRWYELYRRYQATDILGARCCYTAE